MSIRSYLVAWLPRDIKQQLKDILSKCDHYWVTLCYRFAWLTPLYYLCNARFAAQQRAGLAGRYAFLARAIDSQALSGFLRRHIHRLEKGLIMRPRRPVFALDYIDETVLCFVRGADAKIWSAPLHHWAHTVLSAYFEHITPHLAAVLSHEPNKVQRLTELAKLVSEYAQYVPANDSYSQPTPISSVAQQAQPYAADTRPQHDVEYNTFKALCLHRRSVRWFDSKPVPLALIERAIDVAALAPSACNRQSFKFICFDDPTDAQSIGTIAAGTAGFAQQFPALLVLVGDLSAYPNDKDRHVIYIDGALASMQLMLALETLGLASCVINWADEPVAEKKMQAALKLPAYQRVLMLLAVGYADPQGQIPYSSKKSSAELLERRTLASLSHPTKPTT